MFAVAHGSIIALGGVVHSLEKGLHVCMQLALSTMALMGCAMGVEESRIQRDFRIMECVGLIGMALIGVHFGAATTCAVGHFLQGLM